MMEKKTILEGEFEDVIEVNDHFYLIDKKDKIAVLPYTIDSKGLLDKVGVVEDWNFIEGEVGLTVLWDYISTDDKSDLVAANRILFDILGTNVTKAIDWMFLGSLFNGMTSDSPIKLYAVDITTTPIKADEEVEADKTRKKFKMLDSSKVMQSDDQLFLAAYLRVFNYFYINSLSE